LFTGRFQVVQGTSCILCNAADLKINDLKVSAGAQDVGGNYLLIHLNEIEANVFAKNSECSSLLISLSFLLDEKMVVCP
jgi:hypothetical protein